MCQSNRGEIELFSIDSGVTQRRIISPWFINVYMDGVRKEVKMGMGIRGVRLLEDCLLRSDDLVLCGESEENLRVMMRHVCSGM